MRSRTVVAAFAIVAALGSVHAAPVSAQAAPRDDATIRAHAMFDEYWEWVLREFPELATRLGDHRYDDRLADQSAAAVSRRRATQRRIPRAGAQRGCRRARRTTDRVSLRIFRYQLEQAAAQDALCAPMSCSFGSSWSPVTQFNGPQFDLPQLVSATRFSSVRDYDAYLKRLDALPVQIDQLIARMETGMKLGWMPAKIAIARVPGAARRPARSGSGEKSRVRAVPQISRGYCARRARATGGGGPAGDQGQGDARLSAVARLLRSALSAGGERQHRGLRSAARHALLRNAYRREHDDADVAEGDPRARDRRGRAHRQGDGCDGRRRRLQGHARGIPESDQLGSALLLHEGRGHARRLSRHREARRCRAPAPVRRAAAASLRYPRDAPGGRRQCRALLARCGGRQPTRLLRGQRELAVAAAQMDDGNAGAA